MNDEKTQTQESTTRNNENGIQSEDYDPIERADSAAQRLENANKEYARLINEEKNLEARRRLGGKSETTQTQPKVINAEEYAKAALKGQILS